MAKHNNSINQKTENEEISSQIDEVTYLPMVGILWWGTMALIWNNGGGD
jgi:hypothetical protein